MNALVAVGGGAATRFDRFRSAADGFGGRFVEVTDPESRIRLGVVTTDGGALEWARSGDRAVAVLGSGVGRADPDPTRRFLDVERRSGATFLDGAPGDVAGVFADGSKGTLGLGSTDGNQRLFYAEQDDGIVVSTQLALVAAALGPDLGVERTYEDFLLGFGFLPDGRTPYGKVRAVPAGTGREWPEPSARPVRPAELEIPDHPADPRDVRRELHDTLFEVLEDQAGSRRRHAVLLGGFDSALVAAGLRRLGHDVDTYTFSFGDPRYEQRHADRISAQLGTRHHRVEITPEVIGEGLSRFSDHFNQPAPQPHYQLHTAHASRLIAREGHDHIFTGDGCDALFLGYPTVSRRARLVERAAGLPRPLRRGLLGLASAGAIERRLGHVARAARSVLGSLALPWPARGHLPTRYLDDVALDRLRVGPSPPQEESVHDLRIRLAEGLDDLEPVRLAFHGNKLIGQSRSKVEGSLAVSGLPQMSPYRDRRLRAVVGRLPLALLRPAGTPAGSAGKAVLFEMVRERELLPEFVIRMPKQSPSDSPVDQWYAGPLRPVVYRLLDDLPFEYDRSYVDEILAPKWAEKVFRDRISLGHHAFQAIGLLCSYAAFTGRAR